jgi:4-carboxymuconolactone decarboxylase
MDCASNGGGPGRAQRADHQIHCGGKRPETMDADETIVYNFGAELLNTKQVSDPVFKAVKDKFGERGVVDLIAVMGYYELVSMLLNVDRYPLPAGAKPELLALK